MKILSCEFINSQKNNIQLMPALKVNIVSFFNRKTGVIFLLINPKFLVFSISPVISFFTDDRGNSDLDRQSAYDIGKMTMI
jgi:hypothetical protein